jgi:hypothetical protein
MDSDGGADGCGPEFVVMTLNPKLDYGDDDLNFLQTLLLFITSPIFEPILLTCGFCSRMDAFRFQTPHALSCVSPLAALTEQIHTPKPVIFTKSMPKCSKFGAASTAGRGAASDFAGKNCAGTVS